MEEVRQMHIKALINKLDMQGYQWETQNKVRILLQDLFDVAMENDYALRNPTKGVRLKKINQMIELYWTVSSKMILWSVLQVLFILISMRSR